MCAYVCVYMPPASGVHKIMSRGDEIKATEYKRNGAENWGFVESEKAPLLKIHPTLIVSEYTHYVCMCVCVYLCVHV